MAMEFLLFLVVLVAIAVTHFYLQQKDKRRHAFTVHIQGRTEEAETLDFAVTLFEDETQGQWEAKMEKAFHLSEKRRSFNNQRILDIMEAEKQKLKDIKKI